MLCAVVFAFVLGAWILKFNNRLTRRNLFVLGFGLADTVAIGFWMIWISPILFIGTVCFLALFAIGVLLRYSGREIWSDLRKLDRSLHLIIRFFIWALVIFFLVVFLSLGLTAFYNPKMWAPSEIQSVGPRAPLMVRVIGLLLSGPAGFVAGWLLTHFWLKRR